MYTTTQIAQRLNLTVKQAYYYAQKFNSNEIDRPQVKKRRMYSKKTVQRIQSHLNFHQHYLGSQQVAKLLNVPAKTVYYWARRQLIEATKIMEHNQPHYYIKATTVPQLKQRMQKSDSKNVKSQADIMHQFNLTKNECLQMIAKFHIQPHHYLTDAKTNYYPVKMFEQHHAFIDQLIAHRRPHRSFKPPVNVKDAVVTLTSLAHELQIHRTVLYAMLKQNHFLAIKKAPHQRLYTDIKTAQYLKTHYLKYPDQPYYSLSQLQTKLQITKRRLQSVLKKSQVPLIQVLGDKRKFVFAQDLKTLQQTIQQMPTRQTNRQVKTMVKTTDRLPTNQDYTRHQLSQILHCKPDQIIPWVYRKRIPYQFNGEQLFFTPQDVTSIQNQYLNYPAIKLLSQQDALQQTHLTTNPPKFKQLCQTLHLKPIHVLGDARNLYRSQDLDTVNQWQRTH